jgi:hypothetical protein
MSKWSHRIETLIWSLIWKARKFDDVDELIEAHFARWSDSNHQNRKGLTLALKHTDKSEVSIIETGTSAYGTDSSRLFDSFVRSFGGKFFSVDISTYPSNRLKFAKSRNTKFFVMDSVEFLLSLEKLTGLKKVSLFYLDSWDVDWAHPLASAEHGKKEMLAIKPHLNPGTVLVIDDTPAFMEWIPEEGKEAAIRFQREFGVMPGKGAFFKEVLTDLDHSVLYHNYNLVLKFN